MRETCNSLEGSFQTCTVPLIVRGVRESIILQFAQRGGIFVGKKEMQTGADFSRILGDCWSITLWGKRLERC